MSSQGRRKQRVRHEVGDSNQENPSLSKERNKKPSYAELQKETNKKCYQTKKRETTEVNQTNHTNVSILESKDYEPVTYMDSKPKQQENHTYRNRPIEDPIPHKQREIISNWHKFDAITLEEELELGEDHLIGEDFAEILKLSETSCVGQGGYLHLKGEASWGDISESQGLGDLRVTDLVAALATIPFHKQLNIPETMLPTSIITHYVKVAEEQKKSYNPNSTTTSSDDINQKIIQALTLKDTLPASIEDEGDTVHPRITHPEKIKPRAAVSVVASNDSDTRPVTSQSFSFSIPKNVQDLGNQSGDQSRLKDSPTVEDDASADQLRKATELVAALKSTVAFTVPSVEKGQPAKDARSSDAKVDAVLEDWLDAMLDD